MACEFEESGLDDRLLRPIIGLGITQDTEVQTHIIRAVGSGTDVLVQAPPGEGCSAALCNAVLQNLVNGPSKRVLFVVPNQEVGFKCKSILVPLVTHLGNTSMTCSAVVKCNSLRHDVEELGQQPTVVIGQPTRLALLRRSGQMHSDDFGIVVLMQAEHLLDEEQFDQDVLSLVGSLPVPHTGRQNIVCSSQPLPVKATNSFTAMPIEIKFQRAEPSMSGVWALFFRVDPKADMEDQIDALWPLYQTLVIEQVVLFCQDAEAVDEIRDILSNQWFTTTTLYARDGEAQRDEALRDFRLVKSRVMITEIDITQDALNHFDHVDMVIYSNMSTSLAQATGALRRDPPVGETSATLPPAYRWHRIDTRALAHALGTPSQGQQRQAAPRGPRWADDM